ncbi:5-formyltetrahydrofolate cyclo-ligase [Candidatus Peregrinibacteria bacterium]|jgi:5-formyltetrahydrofolate cyclo-ligase|nr:5-formyltetrahydrofolate cyclo-ligase [Candidatus Peregrinibacteria bacterium]MBT3598560.1 5-formyltetrahydrofolate cyclo-ligase [Candidatus Peregrinibacteria bacterium]MBT4367411.1 5-formyltetrahydrofolate cyclo-ligase [Candidatus Peregrinibacteria bacterium]MBT4585291.1 5-formyltetrahydrofolate cyclo-ligase [Candidatus Peregrinibacteria bacterium]MBT6730555.1 5-formyltetrahydrofolate cyclo-ligase [Candidatus Peregrinibacteria bacterium]
MKALEDKRQIREEVEKNLREKDPEEIKHENERICRIILENIREDVRIVCAYVALETEADLTTVIDVLKKRGVKVFLPCSNDSGNGMTFREFDNWEELKSGKFGTKEPKEDSPTLKQGEADIVLIPGRAFDINGDRVGRGGGSYDTWIESERSLDESNSEYWGVALTDQVVEYIPVEDHDQKMDAVITPDEIVVTKKDA